MSDDPSAILLVDDNPDDRIFALRALKREGLGERVLTARDGIEALAALGIEPEDPSRPRPRVVFLDLRMPRMDGWEVLRRIRANPRTARLPVVVVSSSDRPEDVDRSYDLGANSFLLKHEDTRRPGRNLAEAAHYWIDLNHASRRTGAGDQGTH